MKKKKRNWLQVYLLEINFRFKIFVYREFQSTQIIPDYQKKINRKFIEKEFRDSRQSREWTQPLIRRERGR